MNKQKFITDLGRRLLMTAVDSGEQVQLARYAVWAHTGRKYEVIECGDCLGKLMEKHSIHLGLVHRLRSTSHYPPAED